MTRLAGTVETSLGSGAGRAAIMTKRRRLNLAVELPLLAFLVIFVAPIIWMLVLTFEPDRTIVQPGWHIAFTLHNLAAILAPGSAYTIQMLNSILLVFGCVLLCGAIATLAGYGLAKLHVSRFLSLPILAACAVLPLVPPMALVPGFYVTLTQLGLLGGIAGLVLLNTVLNLPFATILMKISFDEIPGSLREAAVIDGAGEARVLTQVMLPLAAPALATTCLFVAIMTWNEFLMALTMTSGGTTAPLSVGIAAMVQPYEIVWGQMAAAGSLAVVPIILLSVIANRKIVAGLTRGAVKG